MSQTSRDKLLSLSRSAEVKRKMFILDLWRYGAIIVELAVRRWIVTLSFRGQTTEQNA